MKKILIVAYVLTLVITISGIASANSFHNETTTPDVWIESWHNDEPAANGWFQLDLPDWYDPAVVTFFEITMGGHGDNSTEPINIFLSFDGKATYKEIASYDVAPSAYFTLTLDILSGELLYNNTVVGPLDNVELTSFNGYDSFYIGYGCHFWHDYSQVDIIDNVPEPMTILLLGFGLLGLGLARRKI